MTTSLRQCDHGECPAAMAYVIVINGADIVLCAHHYNESAGVFMAAGYEVHIRQELATV